MLLAACLLSSSALALDGFIAADVPWRSNKTMSSEILNTLHIVMPSKRLIAGVTPSIAEIVADVRHSRPAGALLSKQAVVDALVRAAQGKQGPILVVSDGVKMRVMALRPKEGVSPTP